MREGRVQAAVRGGPLQGSLSVGPRDPGSSALAMLTRSTETLQQLLVLAGETWAEKAPGRAACGSLRRPAGRNVLGRSDGRRQLSSPMHRNQHTRLHGFLFRPNQCSGNLGSHCWG